MNSLLKLKPKCIIPDEKGHIQCLGHSAEGYITPCCFLDAYTKDRGMAEDIFYQEKFKISNVKDIKKDILESKEWVDFYIMLQEVPAAAPSVCHKICGIDAKSGDKYDV